MNRTDASPRRYRIAEVARRTGFPPTTLRYYESAGVLEPPERDAAGYRVYSDRDVERLRLVARAKDLGCTLDEISRLVRAWDTDECGPVKEGLRSVVDAKVGALRRHIADEVAFVARLQATADSLAGQPADGPCDDACGCTTPTAAEGSHGKPRGSLAIACTLDGGELQTRFDEWRALLLHVRSRTAVAGGVRLTFGPGVSPSELGRLVAAEVDCCRFFAFALTVDRRGIALEVTAPEDGQDVLRSLFGAPPAVSRSPGPR